MKVGGNLTKLWQKQFCSFFRHSVVWLCWTFELSIQHDHRSPQ